ncbi:kinesin-like protein KIN-7C isoform X2 [Populus trichocarpa]|uniref:kinesin-like protein KIN-7C isoform X2 n=1 Tax=Populus trichocarpa TaxID=3694 RepID=UPI0022799EF1|nr:kinesin-like protein KIN-7C isoform X2 [Populus trichocarpa]
MGAADADGPMHGLSGGGEEKIFVSVRLRPLNAKEIARNDVSDWESINYDTVIYRNNLPVSERSMYPTAYTFDRVFGSDCSTKHVYGEGAKEVALSVVSGINSSVFAYGQTSSGKTYTMSGITEYTIADIYDYVEKHKEREFTLKFSAMEIYNESVRDLLGADATPLRLLDDPERGTVVERLTEESIRDWNHFKELLSVCEAQRQIGETSLNEASSRSHQILRLTVESSTQEFLGHYKSSTLAATVNFVDLAGSERASQSLSAGMRLKEGCHINRSLLTLGTVIRKLSKGKNGHVPFRDSKLTRILQSSLGGNARTAIICTMSPARSHVEQSRNTLLFASCAKEVTTNAQVNVVVSDKTLVKQLQRELARMENELKNTRPDSVTSDSTIVLREKDLQIEKLMNEVAELTRRLDLAQSQIENLQQVSEGSRSSTADPDHHYNKLRVRNSFRTDNSVSYSLILEDPPSLDLGARSFDASQCSDVQSSRSSGANFIQFPVFEENFLPESFSTHHSTSTTNFVGNDLHEKKDADGQTNQNFDDNWKEVQCIEVEESSVSQYSNSNTSESRPYRFEESNMPSPDTKTDTLGLTKVGNEERTNQEVKSPPLKEQKELNGLQSTFIIPSPEKLSPWLLEAGLSESRSFLSRSRSCRATLMDNSPGFCFKKVEAYESTPLFGFEKDFPGRPEGFQRKLPALKYDPDIERLSRNVSRNSICSSAVNELKEESGGTSTDWRTASVGNSDMGLMYMADYLEQETTAEDAENIGDDGLDATQHNMSAKKVKDVGLDSICYNVSAKSVKDVGLDPIQDGASAKNVKDVGLDPIQDGVSAKNVKDVGLDPIQDDAESASKWPLEFKNMQSKIIELWHACSVSLVHRTHFLLLFKGDPADSFYLEVEIRRMSLLKETLSRGSRTIVHGQVLTSTSSKKALSHERQMLAREMQKRLTREERENLFLKWGVPLSGNNRRLQLVHRLWTKTTDMDHITESAALVAKLVGFIEQEQALKEMFGLLNFTPTYPSRRKSSIWKRSVLSFL